MWRVLPPPPAAPIPKQPAALVARLAATTTALDAAIDRWDKHAPPPRAVTLLALYQQRVLRLLAHDPPLARRVLPRYPAARDDVTAREELFRLTPPTTAHLHTGPPAPPLRLLGWYREAQRRFGVRWQLLAAVNFVESAFGKVRDASSAGAQGPMQFMPGTWQAYGLGGDVHEPRDAILGAANYLAASGARHDEARALFAYNRSQLYVDAIRRYARRIAADPHSFFRYYAWQVFVRTPSGDRRITGP